MLTSLVRLQDFLKRFGYCTEESDASTCYFTNVRTGLIVSMLSIGTMVGALAGAS